MGVEVKILGKTYEVRTDKDQDFALETARVLNKKMEELARHAYAVSREKIAVLAALNVTGELLQLKNAQKADLEKALSETQAILDIFDAYEAQEEDGNQKQPPKKAAQKTL